MSRLKVLKSMNLRRAERHIQEWARQVYYRDHPPVPVICWTRVYQLVDPRNGEVFYIGKTYNPEERIRQHEYEVTRGSKSAKSERMRELWRVGMRAEMRTIGLFTDNIRALEHEASLIRSAGPLLTNNQPDIQ